MAQFKFEADATEESGNFQPVPEGEYVLGIKKAEYEKTSTKKHMLKLELEIEEGPYTGRKVWTNIVFNPKGQPGHGLTVQALKAFGFEYDGTLNIDTDEWVSRTCRARLVKESYEKVLEDGRKETRWKNAIPTAGYVTDKAAPAPKKPAPANNVDDVEEVPF